MDVIVAMRVAMVVTVTVVGAVPMAAGRAAGTRITARVGWRMFSTHPLYLPSVPAAIVNWLRFCSTSWLSAHFSNSASFS